MEDEDVLTELDISDDHENGQVRVLVHQTADPELFVYDGTDTGVTVDFTKSLIQLKKVSVSLCPLLCCQTISTFIHYTDRTNGKRILVRDIQNRLDMWAISVEVVTPGESLRG